VFGVVLVRIFFFRAAVMIGVKLAGFQGVMRRVGGVAGGDVGMMARHFDVVLGVVLGRFAMVQGGVFVVLGGFGVVIVGGVLGRHGTSFQLGTGASGQRGSGPQT
jgi:hypothetical protein